MRKVIHLISIILFLLLIAFYWTQNSLLPSYHYHISFAGKSQGALRIISIWVTGIVSVLQIVLYIFLIRKKENNLLDCVIVGVVFVIVITVNGLAAIADYTLIKEIESPQGTVTIVEEVSQPFRHSELTIYQRVNWYLVKSTGVSFYDCGYNVQCEWLSEDMARMTVFEKGILYYSGISHPEVDSIKLEPHDFVIMQFDYENSKIITEAEWLR